MQKQMEANGRGPVLAKIQWGNKEHCVRQKRTTIGRHSSSSKGCVDIDLGDSNFISRVHLEIVYEKSAFFLKCNGKNGIFVNDSFQRPKDGLQILPKRCRIGFPSAGLLLMFSSLLEGPTVPRRPCLSPPVSDAEPASSPAETVSADSSGPVSPAGPGQVTVPGDTTEGANGTSGGADLTVIEDGDPLLHHSYSGGPAEEPVTVQEGPTEEVREEQDGRKPPFSYAQLIAQAVSSARDQRLTLSGIYSYITRHYPYFRTADKGWQNSIRHNLSLNRNFVRVSRGQETPGKGSFWRLDPRVEAAFVERAFRGKTSGRRRAGQPGDVAPAPYPVPLSRWPAERTNPPCLSVREPAPASPTRSPGPAPTPAPAQANVGAAAAVMVTPGRSGGVARARLVPLSCASGDSFLTSSMCGSDVIDSPEISFLSEECLISPEPCETEVTVVSSTVDPLEEGTVVSSTADPEEGTVVSSSVGSEESGAGIK